MNSLPWKSFASNLYSPTTCLLYISQWYGNITFQMACKFDMMFIPISKYCLYLLIYSSIYFDKYVRHFYLHYFTSQTVFYFYLLLLYSFPINVILTLLLAYSKYYLLQEYHHRCENKRTSRVEVNNCSSDSSKLGSNWAECTLADGCGDGSLEQIQCECTLKNAVLDLYATNRPGTGKSGNTGLYDKGRAPQEA